MHRQNVPIKTASAPVLVTLKQNTGRSRSKNMLKINHTTPLPQKPPQIFLPYCLISQFVIRTGHTTVRYLFDLMWCIFCIVVLFIHYMSGKVSVCVVACCSFFAKTTCQSLRSVKHISWSNSSSPLPSVHLAGYMNNSICQLGVFFKDN